MEQNKPGFAEFFAAVDCENQPFITALHEEFVAHGCKIQVKEAKSGYVVSYVLHKKTVANFVFRKAGIFIRIYANHVQSYMDFLDTLPHALIETIETAPVCKRLIDPNDCNSKCAMGYDFLLRGNRLQKCRNSAFFFLLCKENNPFIQEFVVKELTACGTAD